MSLVDTAFEAHGGLPGSAAGNAGDTSGGTDDAAGASNSAFSQNHLPPAATTLAAEQVVQKEQLKAHKKAAKATSKTIAFSAIYTMTRSHFYPNGDLDALVPAAGAASLPKSSATPAKAAGGQATKITDTSAICAIRWSTLARSA